MKQIPLTQNQLAIVDDEDHEWLSGMKWCVRLHKRSGKFYAVTGLRLSPKKSVLLSMHRMILHLGRDDKRECDHINGNSLDNRRSNLRICTHAENQRNKPTRKDNKSGYKGVFLSSRFGRKKKWYSQIQVNGRLKTLGYFYLPEEAALAYNVAAQSLHGEFSRLNHINKGEPCQNGLLTNR